MNKRLSRGRKVARHVKFTTHTHVLPRLGMSGAMFFLHLKNGTVFEKDDLLKTQNVF